jgi:DNA/RNA endonuclease G (NUC1)
MKKLLWLLLFVSTWATAQDTVTIYHQRYSTTFDTVLLYPVKVHWTVTSDDICAPRTPRRVERKNSFFKKDPDLPKYTNLRTVYLNNPGSYQRGHNMNAADNSCDLQQMKESHYFSNITPQTKELNEHVWGDLEDYTRDLVAQYGKVEVWCGGYGYKETMRSVTVPLFCWKIILYNGKVEAYIMPNDHSADIKPFYEYRTSVSSIRVASHLPLPGIPNI